MKQLGLAMANYISANDLLPPLSVDQAWNNQGTAIPMPHQNWSQHARLLPYLEQQATYNAINWNFGSRWSDGDTIFTDGNPPDVNAAGGNDSIVQYTALCQQISSFLCPSDANLGASGMFSFNGAQRLVGSTNYPSNVGLNRRINGCDPLNLSATCNNGASNTGNWQMSGPNYIGTTWDQALQTTQGLNTMTDGTSNTTAFGEWVKGPGLNGPPLGKNGLGIVYYLIVGGSRADSNAFATDYQFAQACASSPNTSANQAWNWKGEWWGFGGTMIYSHTNLPNRTACQYNDNNTDWRATITLVNSSSNHPGGVNLVFFDGSVHFIKNSVNPQTYYGLATPANGEVISSDSY